MSRTWSPLGASQKRSLDDIYRVSLGFVTSNFNPGNPASSNTAVTSQTVYAVGVAYRAGQVVTNINWIVATAGAGTTPTNMFCGISNTTTVLAQTADVKASAQWTATGLASLALSAPLTIPSDGIYYHLILANGTWSVTQMALARGSGLVVANGSNLLIATAGTAATALPATGAAITLASSGTPLPFYTAST